MEGKMLEYIASSYRFRGKCWAIPSSKKLVHALRTSLGDNALNALQKHLHEATRREWLAYAKRVKASKRVNADQLALPDKHAADLTPYQIKAVQSGERVWWRRAILPPGKALVEELRTISAAARAAAAAAARWAHIRAEQKTTSRENVKKTMALERRAANLGKEP